MEQEHTLTKDEIREKAHTFGRRLIASVVKNLLLKTALWGVIFALVGFLYAKLVFQGEGIPESLRAFGSLAILAAYLFGGIIAGLCFGALAAVRGAADNLSEIIGTGVSMAFLKFLPEDRDTVSVEEVRRILDSVAPAEGGLSGLPLRLVRDKVQSDLLSQASAEGSPTLKVEEVKSYITDRLAETAVRDIRIKAWIAQIIGWFMLFIFLALPLLLVLIF